MKLASYLFLSATVCSLLACSEPKNSTPQLVGQPLNMPATQQPANSLPAGNAPTTAPTPASAANPPHGQPNHRCDIPVGAPLSTPAQPNLSVPVRSTPTAVQPVTTPQPATISTTPASQNTTTIPAGTNPPHGQPGHDCSVPVGAPLTK